MSNQEWLQDFPTRRIKPVDGMAVTADVWAEAHGHHQARMRLHERFCHGPGIVAGLDVIASEPPDQSVFIQPGVAVDPQGDLIVLTEPVTYHIESSRPGLLYLLLSYGESQTRPTGDEGGPLYIRSEYGIEALPAWPDEPRVEIARVRRQGQEAPIFDAEDRLHPGPNEIDLRFRRIVGASSPQLASIAVSYVGGGRKDVRHGQGVENLARAFARSGDGSARRRLHVDHNVSLVDDLRSYTLLYLVGQGAFQLSREEMQGLYDYIQGGGKIFIESCRRDLSEGEPASDTAFYNLMGDMGLNLVELRPDHPLLQEPYLFAAPPSGFETEGSPRVMVSEEVIFSTYDYGCLWQGERRRGAAARGEIRAALEWGANIVTYALKRTGGRS